ncbi:MAG: efflux RND transporter periplasmic adaptor subunit [Bacteroidales bacterium]|nr:efflux RND transporter periplasmic adaptor subunit [Bacteroidales bacterium]MBN2763119.1 efflux RND transporter periplasmic adaptor subunit [Bacteroidales bacterium]
MDAMDRKIEKKGIPRKYIWIGLFTVIFILLIVKMLFGDKSTKLNVDEEKFTVATVIHDKYQDFISVNGTVEPIKTIYLDAVEAGRVEEILIEEGSMVKKGDVIIRLSNYNLLLDISSNEADVSRAINDLKTTRINLENQKIQTSSLILQLQYSLKQLERQFHNNEKLLAGNHISREDYEVSKELYEEAKLQLDLQKQKHRRDSIYMITRVSSDEESIGRMQRNLMLTRKRLENLEITAPVDGELATLNPEVGEVINYGSRIGTINILDSYKMRAEIDEHYIARIQRGLNGDFTFAGGKHTLRIVKVYPEVKNGTFAVDMAFTSSIPAQIRIGQTARIHLELGESEDALLIPRGGFYQSTGGQWIYVIDKSGDIAVKRNIRIGRQNPSYYEVLEGLTEGEKVIVSGYESFGDNDKLIIRNRKK